MITQELQEMGMDKEDIEDLQALAALMHEFLVRVPNIEVKLELSHNKDLLDNIQLYLLGLPNKLGPLGFIALHQVLDGEETGETGEIVDVVVEGPRDGRMEHKRHHSRSSKEKETQPRAEPESEPEPEPERAPILA